ncbi:putative mucin TcMUCII [Trypanosoma cruzi]|uniref:Putative mucin TcMUCII n=1 Tax=Trypanosoma cruzi TaxID=5693 RepID=A0A2V2XLV3_TRYCR|nr:putative mucin TcMUCII [Trypanosoma cruzi]
MMMCRLLCALLVLALCCCCPSVCVAEEAVASSQTTTTTAQPPVPKEEPDPKPNVDVVQPPPPDSPQGTGQPGTLSTGSVPDQGNVDGEGPDVTAGKPQSNVVPNTLQAEGKDGTTGRQSGTNTSADKAAREAKDPAQTTTTTTQAPTTTTTTTQAPSTTTTEAPTVSTTSAPSRLREMDGSLSSSAWVCAPLLLAASALAYTAVG